VRDGAQNEKVRAARLFLVLFGVEDLGEFALHIRAQFLQFEARSLRRLCKLRQHLLEPLLRRVAVNSMKQFGDIHVFTAEITLDRSFPALQSLFEMRQIEFVFARLFSVPTARDFARNAEAGKLRKGHFQPVAQERKEVPRSGAAHHQQHVPVVRKSLNQTQMFRSLAVIAEQRPVSPVRAQREPV
jgi:hypothetical protein